VTDRGQPLWIIRSATPEQASIPAEEFEKEMADMMKEPMSEYSLSDIIINSRR
jgi:hypothetical protein